MSENHETHREEEMRNAEDLMVNTTREDRAV